MIKGRGAKKSKKVLCAPCFSYDSCLPELNNRIEFLFREKKVVIIGITGGSGAGKTHISKKIKGKILPMDDYYKGIEITGTNFDRPQALDLELLKKHLSQLKKGNTIKKPVYDFKVHLRSGYEEFCPERIIIVDGLFALSEKLVSELDLRVFVDCPKNTRLMRRMERDIRERGRTKESVIKQFTETVEPMHQKYVEPLKKQADLIIEN